MHWTSGSQPPFPCRRMFEMAKDEIVESQTYEIMAGYYSPVCVCPDHRSPHVS